MSERFVILYINKNNKDMNENLEVIEESDGLGGYVYIVKEIVDGKEYLYEEHPNGELLEIPQDTRENKILDSKWN